MVYKGGEKGKRAGCKICARRRRCKNTAEAFQTTGQGLFSARKAFANEGALCRLGPAVFALRAESAGAQPAFYQGRIKIAERCISHSGSRQKGPFCVSYSATAFFTPGKRPLP